ncbi:hypothetical protein MMC13_006516 [Lambiella insularis]|nr:hypothetical protein [Lambiella insularis]
MNDAEMPLETPPAEEKLPEITSGGGSPTSIAQEATSRDGGPRVVVSSPRRNGIPPKRPATTVKRAEGLVAASTTKSLSTTQPIAGSGLSKPPARPMGAPLGRRPVPGVATSTPSTFGHKLRASTSSIEDLRKSAGSEGVENKRPIVAGAAKRVSLAPALMTKSTVPKAPSASDRRYTISNPIANDKSVTSSRTGVTSPTKASTRSTTTTARTPALPGTQRSSRPPPSSTRAVNGASLSEAAKKRLSTIPASPAPVMASVLESDQHSRPVRPGLRSRKSTMSVTIEQRLREMELVNDMLKVAMAEDGDESDEVKEEYGRKVDEKLADLREQLEEARRKEGKLLVGSPDRLSAPDDATEAYEESHQAVNPDEKEKSRIEGLSSALTSSQEKASLGAGLAISLSTVAMLEAEIESMQTKMYLYSEEAAQASRDVEQATERIRVEHSSKVNELVAGHKIEVEAIRSQLESLKVKHLQYVERSLKDIENAKEVAAQQSAKDITRLSSEQTLAHEAALQAMEHELKAEKTKTSDTVSRSHTLASQVSKLEHLLEEEKQLSETQLSNVQARFDRLLKEKDELSQMKDKDTLELQLAMEQMQVTHRRELEEAEAAVSQHELDTRRTQMEAQQEIRKLEINAVTTSNEHREVLRTKESEVSSMGQIVESLQDELQDLQERKNREIESLRLSLIREHEDAMSKARAKHELTIQAIQDEERDKSLKTATEHEKEIQDLRESMESTNQTHESALSKLTSTKADMQETVSSLRAEVSSAKDVKSLLEKTLEEASEEVAGLKKVLETFDKDIKVKDEQHASLMSKMKEEVEHTVKALQEKSTEGTSMADKHATEMKSLREMHAKELEVLKAELTENADSSLQELQAKYDLLQENLKNSNETHMASLDSVKKEHATALQSNKESHENELRELKESHSSLIACARNDSDTKAAERTRIFEQKCRKRIEDLQHQHENELTNKEDAHQRVLSELQDQVLQHRKDLANAENELQSSRESQVGAERERQESHRKELDALQSQLATYRLDAVDRQNELDSVREEKSRLETLYGAQSAEKDELKITLAQDKETIERLSATTEEAGRLLSDTSEIDALREELLILQKSYIAEVSKSSKLEETMSIEAEKREKERKQGADVRDRLVNQLEELECFRRDLPLVTEQAQQHYQAAEAARNEAWDIQKELDLAILSVKEHEARHAKSTVELERALALSKEREMHQEEVSAELSKALAAAEKHETLHQELSAELDRIRAESAKDRTRRSSESLINPEIIQELDALQIIADEERDKNDRLRGELAEITATAEARAIKVREMEVALKVTTAELTEMKTKRIDGKDFITTSTPKRNVRSNPRAAQSNEDGFVEVIENPEGEELGSSIEGTMAGIREQIRQLEGVNEDMIGESQRLVNMLSKATSPKTSLSL